MKVLVSGGGTGGHIYPALSIIEEFSKERNNEILYVGKKKSMESDIVPKANINFKGITVEGFNRKNKVKNILVGFKLFVALIQALIILLKFKPDIVIGTGGYVSGPVLFIAAMLRKKTYIHEQNSFPGMTNRILSKYVDRVFISYHESMNKFNKKSKVKYTGNPVRKAFKENIDHIKRDEKNYMKILSFGGSGGAKKINDLMLEIIQEFNGNDLYHIDHVTGKKYYDEFMNVLENSRIDLEENIKVYDYLKDMPEYMLNSDLVISRAGAITITELKYTNTPSILIPSPNVTDDHQRFNAKSMEDEGLSKMILEENIEASSISDFIQRKDKIFIMKQNLIDHNSMDASRAIYNQIMKDVHL